MRRLFSRDRWQLKHSTLWVVMAPVLAMGLVVLLGTAAAPGSFVVSGGSLDTALLVRPDAIFDDLARNVPDLPGVGGRLGTEEPSKVEIPITGTKDGDTQVPPGTDGAVTGIPSSVLPAYQRAANEMALTHPGCGLTWPLLAAIGKVESSHASGGRVDALGNTRGLILGPVLDGRPGMAAIVDTDNGSYDGHTAWDRAVGPMQFIPGTWKVYAKDGNGDGGANPHNIYDATRAAGEYLCANGANLRDPRGLVEAVLRYNHSMDYVSTVLRWMETYSKSAVTVNDRTGEIPRNNDREGNVERDDNPDEIPDDRQTTTRPPATTRTTSTRPPTSRPATSRPPSVQPTQTSRPPKPPLTIRPTPTKPPVTTPTKSPNTNTPTTPTQPTTPTPTTPTLPPCPTTTPTPTPTEPTPTPPPTSPSPTPTPTCAPAGGPGGENGGPTGGQTGGTGGENGGTGGTQNPAPTTGSAVVDEIKVSPQLMAWTVGVGLIVLLVAVVHDRRRRSS